MAQWHGCDQSYNAKTTLKRRNYCMHGGFLRLLSVMGVTRAAMLKLPLTDATILCMVDS